MKYQLKKQSQKPLSKQQGASLIEYAVLAALIVVAAVAAISALGGGITTTFGTILTKLNGG